MAMTKQLWSVNALAVELGRDRRTHYREQVNTALGAAQTDLTRAVQEVERNLIETAHAADATVRRASNRLTGKLTLAIAAVVLAAAGLIWTTGTLTTWWQRSTRDALAAEIERLQGELPVLQARAAD